VGVAASCGAAADTSCCEAARVPAGRFYRGCDRADDVEFKDMAYPATVSAFVLDRYEVTVGRFRAFVNAGNATQGKHPADAAGAHPGLPTSGWDSSWNMKLSPDTATLVAGLKCDARYQTWTDAPGSNENRPIGCVTWYEAMAFCIWDGGYLPTEAEWSFAAAGGPHHRAYPWSTPPGSTTIDCDHANYQVGTMPAMYCANGTVGGSNRVGFESPLGDGRWGHADLAGNVWEWTLDWFGPYDASCADCAQLVPAVPAERVLRGGGFFNEDVGLLRSAYRDVHHNPGARVTSYGLRCARRP
jgi:formylglycine-generating enzyme required for sulfatase activity